MNCTKRARVAKSILKSQRWGSNTVLMANVFLTSAKQAKNDEFYTQYSDIQREIEAYLEYDPHTFQNKVVYSNCDDPFESNFFRYFALNFNRLGLKQLITTSYKPSPIANTQLGLFGNDRTLAPAKGRPKITANKLIINEVHDMDNDGAFNLTDVAEQLKANSNNEWAPLDGDGDFQSNECIELLKRSDIVVTNPPFSLFREYVKQLFDYHKKFIIVGNLNAISYKEIFPLIKDDRMWLGNGFSSGNAYFATPNARTNFASGVYDEKTGLVKFRNCHWFTNLDHGRRHQPLNLMTMAENLKFNKKMKGKASYDRYDNYNAIEVPFTDAIPNDYADEMGVPISFLDKYNPDQFEIVGITKAWFRFANKVYPSQTQVSKDGEKSTVSKLNDGATIKLDKPPEGKTYYIVDGEYFEQLYARIIVKRRKAAA